MVRVCACVRACVCVCVSVCRCGMKPPTRRRSDRTFLHPRVSQQQVNAWRCGLTKETMTKHEQRLCLASGVYGNAAQHLRTRFADLQTHPDLHELSKGVSLARRDSGSRWMYCEESGSLARGFLAFVRRHCHHPAGLYRGLYFDSSLQRTT
jgi:hypothetical protein